MIEPLDHFVPPFHSNSSCAWMIARECELTWRKKDAHGRPAVQPWVMAPGDRFRWTEHEQNGYQDQDMVNYLPGSTGGASCFFSTARVCWLFLCGAPVLAAKGFCFA